MKSPGLSIVVPVYAALSVKAERSFRVFFNGLNLLAQQEGLDAEILLIFWKQEKESDHPLIPFIKEHARLTTRVVYVPPKVHELLDPCEASLFLPLAAMNVGIRRANGPFILVTRPDVLFSKELVAILAKRNFAKGAFYRINRFEVDGELEVHWSLSEQLSFCIHNIANIKGKDPNYLFLINPPDGFEEHPVRYGLKNKFNKWYRRVFWTRERRIMNHADVAYCSWFTLMSAEDWSLIRGFPELALSDTELEGIVPYASLAAGLRQVIFDPLVRIYFLGKENTPADNPLQSIIKRGKHPKIGQDLIVDFVKWSLKNNQLPILNPPDWGAKGAILREQIFGEF